MLNTTQIALLEAIKASLFDYTPKYPDDTDWNEVVKEAKAQTVMGLISPVIPIKDQSTNVGIANYIRLLHEQDQLIKLLDENGIPCVILKGFAAAQYYPKPHLRAIGDVDLLVPFDKFHEAEALMESNEYVYIHGKEYTDDKYNEPRHIGYTKNGIEFELHHHFSSRGFDIDEILEQAIQKREYKKFNDYKIPSLPDIENGLVFLGHLNQHLSAYDLGLRQIIDWEMYVYKVLDKTRWNNDFLPLAEKVGLKKLAVNVTVMCMEYLGLPNNIGLKVDHKKGVSGSLLNLLFESGNFGRKISKTTQKNNNNGVISTGIYQIKKNGFFPYFQDMGLKRWKSCQKHKSLRPFAWIYGILRSIGWGISSILKSGNVKKQINAGNEKYILFEKLGIQASSKKS